MKWKVQLCELNYDNRERDAVNKVIKGQWLTMGQETASFEQEFSTFIGHTNTGLFVSSATAGLHLILMALGIGRGDEVIIPGLTFVSDANVVLQQGALPVFADSVGLNNLNVSVEDIKRKISSKTKAIVIVHFAGFPMDLQQLKEICLAKDIKLIEDCAHAPGASINGKMCGNIADFSFFSFFSNKNLAVGEGGMVFANDKSALEKIRLMRSHGMSAATLQRHLGRAISYDVEHIGLNYRADEMRAALGRVQLKKLLSGNRQRKTNFETYAEKLKSSDIIIPVSNISNSVSSYHIMPVILPVGTDRKSTILSMKAEGIQTSVHYPNFSEFTAYSNYCKNQRLPIVNEITHRELTLPMHPRMTFKDVDMVVNSLLKAL